MGKNDTILHKQLESIYRDFGIIDLMKLPDATDIAINDNQSVWVEKSGEWICYPTDLGDDYNARAMSFGQLIINALDMPRGFSGDEPILSATLPTGERCQIVLPPIADKYASITIRIPSKQTFSMDDYESAGLFEKIEPITNELPQSDQRLLELQEKGDYRRFLEEAIYYKKNIIISGATGGGKTTFMKTLVNLISNDQRIITIEDARELFINQPNKVHFIYDREAKQHQTTAKACLEATLRMKPNRIILAEVRGDEAFYFIRACGNGHSGSMTSCHADSALMAYEQLAMMIKGSTEGSGISYEVIRKMIDMVIDISIHFGIHDNKRVITGIDFNPQRKRNSLIG